VIEHSALEQGWYLAREVKPEGKGPMCLVWVQGRKPFLLVWPAIIGMTSMEWYRGGHSRNEIGENAQWEFVQRIDIPQEVTP
jgi:hypothetical protein